MEYTIEFRPSVLKQLKKIPKRDLVRIKKRIDELARNLPAPSTAKMKGNNPFHRVRTGDYRIVYEIHGDRVVILIVKSGRRKDIDEKLS